MYSSEPGIAPSIQHVHPHTHSAEYVVAELEKVIAYCSRHNDRNGYFAAMYHVVSVKIQEAIAKGRFENGDRIQQLGIIFVKFYLDAWHRWRQGNKPALCWQLAFEASERDEPIILQHLLLGVNAHINFDLGMAVSQTMQNENLYHIKNDFQLIDQILNHLYDKVLTRVFKMAPMSVLLKLHHANRNELLIHFSIPKARMGAWGFANEIHQAPADKYPIAIEQRDKKIAMLANNILYPVQPLKTSTAIISAFERFTPARVIEMIMNGR